MKAVYRLLRFSKESFALLWDWTFLYSLLESLDDTIRVLAAEILAQVLDMNDQERHLFIAKYLKELDENSDYLSILE